MNNYLDKSMTPNASKQGNDSFGATFLFMFLFMFVGGNMDLATTGEICRFATDQRTLELGSHASKTEDDTVNTETTPLNPETHTKFSSERKNYRKSLKNISKKWVIFAYSSFWLRILVGEADLGWFLGLEGFVFCMAHI